VGEALGREGGEGLLITIRLVVYIEGSNTSYDGQSTSPNTLFNVGHNSALQRSV
jgi:hypothetical protein